MIGALIAVLHVYQLLIIIRAVQTWLPVDERQPWVRLLAKITEPILAPFRPFTRAGSVDLSPILAIVVVEVIIRILG
jgi:YggT family protein